LKSITGKMRRHFARQEKLQEKVQRICRAVIRDCSRAVSALHRGDGRLAGLLIRRGGQNLRRLETMLDQEGWGMLYNTVVSAQQEYAEAVMLQRLLRGENLPDFSQLGVLPRAYAFALSDVVGELYRALLNRMRTGDPSGSERILGQMEEIYEGLMELDFPQSVLPGMKHRLDRVRRIVEQARRDLTIAFAEG